MALYLYIFERDEHICILEVIVFEAIVVVWEVDGSLAEITLNSRHIKNMLYGFIYF